MILKSCLKIVAMTWLLVACDSPSADRNAHYKILLLGDSITQAQTSHASFRYLLWKKLLDAKISFDFVGSMNKNLGRGEPPQPDYKGQAFDPDHEGHFAWTVNDILHGRNVNNGSGKGQLSDWLETYDVDIALVHLGTNDAFYRQSNAATAEKLARVIQLLRSDNPKITILLAQVIPTSRTAEDAKAVASLSAYIPEFADDIDTRDSPVIVVDMYSGFDASKDTYDAVHPNALGEEKIAERWFSAIDRYLSE